MQGPGFKDQHHKKEINKEINLKLSLFFCFVYATLNKCGSTYKKYFKLDVQQSHKFNIHICILCFGELLKDIWEIEITDPLDVGDKAQRGKSSTLNKPSCLC